MRPTVRSWAGLILTIGLLTSACFDENDATEESAEDYPSKPIRWIVTFDPGGGSDTDFRRLEPHLEDILGVEFEVEYRVGGDGAVGWAEMVNAPPDGYTIGSVVLPHIIFQPRALEDAGYSTDDFSFISMNAYAPQILFVDASDPAYESFEEFEQDVEANQGEIDMAGAADFNASHASWGLLKDQGLDTNWVSTGEGSTEAVAAVLGGHFPVGITSAQGAVTSDEIIALAVFAEERYEYLPDVPTVQELGYEGVQETDWGIGAPADMPPEKREVIWAAVQEALKRDEVIRNMENEGQTMIGLGPEETEQLVADMTADVEDILPVLEDAAQ
jgi:tripartite-type tricarboxylate transporter receptor subunit TctC